MPGQKERTQINGDTENAPGPCQDSWAGDGESPRWIRPEMERSDVRPTWRRSARDLCNRRQAARASFLPCSSIWAFVASSVWPLARIVWPVAR
jgi:hypothetical protein